MKNYIYILVLLSMIIPLSAQSLLDVKRADVFKQTKDGRRIIYGNVRIEYDIYKVSCDSAVVGKDFKSAKLFKNVVLKDTAFTVHCDKADIYRYSEKRSAYFTGNVVLKNNDVTVYGKYANLVEMFNRVTVKDSVRVEYQPFPSILFCRELKYDTKKQIIISNSIDTVFALGSLRYYKLKTNGAIYNLKSSTLNLNYKYDLEVYDLKDSVENIFKFPPIEILNFGKTAKFKGYSTLSATKGQFNFDTNTYSVSGNVKASNYNIDDPDTTFFSCEYIDYSEKQGVTRIDKNIRLDKGTLSVTTDKGEFYHDNDLLKLLKNPKIVFENHTITGDTIFIYADKKTYYPKKATIINNAFVESIPDSSKMNEKNQMSGKKMNMWFKEQKLSKIIVSKEAEALYFIREGEKSPSKASNYLLGDTLLIDFDAKGITKALVKGGCEGSYSPKATGKKTIKRK